MSLARELSALGRCDGRRVWRGSCSDIRSMNGISSAKDGREVPLVRGRVVTFRPPARIAVPAARRTPQLVPGVVVPLDGWRYSRRRPGLFPKMEWFVVGSVATLLLLFFVRLFLR